MRLTVVVDGVTFEVVPEDGEGQAVGWLYRRWKVGGGKEFEVRDADGRVLARATAGSRTP